MSTPPNKPRIAIGTWEIAGYVETLTSAFEALGFDVTAAVRAGDAHFFDSLYDLDIAKDVAAVPFAELERRVLDRSMSAPRRIHGRSSAIERLHWLIANHDVFVFVYGSLYPDRFCRAVRMGQGREFALLRRLGKKVVCVHVGPEVRHVSAFDQEMAFHRAGRLPLAEANPCWSRVSVTVPLRNLRRAELHADAIFSQPNQASLALRPYHHLFAPLDLTRFRPEVPGRERPLVIHAPSVRPIKGTPAILAALERLRARGVDFELRVFENTHNAKLMEELRGADVVVDQLHLPLHGRLGVEAMASGCALATCNDERFEPYPAQRPIWHLGTDDLDAQLFRLLTDRDLRVRLGHEGARYAHRWHAHTACAERILDALGLLRPGSPPSTPEHEPTFFARHYRPPEPLSPRLRALNEAVSVAFGLPNGVSRAKLAARALV